MRRRKTAAAPAGEAHDASAPSSAASALEAELFHRLVASAAGLPHVCVFKRCRRRKRCFGALVGGEPPCKRHHLGLGRARYRSALAVLGWAPRKAPPAGVNRPARPRP